MYIVNETFKCLCMKYLSENPDSPISYGTYLKLRPFSVRIVTAKDVETFCCKKHLHARWAVSTLQLCKQQKVEPSFTNYFFSMPFPIHVLKITIQPLSLGVEVKLKRSFVPMLQRNGVKSNKS